MSIGGADTGGGREDVETGGGSGEDGALPGARLDVSRGYHAHVQRRVGGFFPARHGDRRARLNPPLGRNGSFRAPRVSTLVTKIRRPATAPPLDDPTHRPDEAEAVSHRVHAPTALVPTRPAPPRRPVVTRTPRRRRRFPNSPPTRRAHPVGPAPRRSRVRARTTSAARQRPSPSTARTVHSSGGSS